MTERQVSASGRPHISYRALVIGALLIPPNLYWLMLAETVHRPVFSTLFTMFYNVTFTLFLLVVLNTLIRRVLPRLALEPSELLMVYVMLAIATGIFGHDLMLVLMQNLTGFWFATPENEWQVVFGRYLPHWTILYDEQAIRDYHEGDSTLYTAAHLKAWMVPLLAWGGLLFVLLWIMVCMNVIIRKQWTENEKLAYPVIQLPLELARGGGLLSNRRLWLGFGIAGAIDTVNAIHGVMPSIPAITPVYDLQLMFAGKPWNAIGWTPAAVYPFVVGLGYFLPVNLSFSAWFFHLVWKADLVFRDALSIWGSPGPYRSYHTAGAWFVLALLPLWMARQHFRDVLSEVLRGRSAATAASEAMSYRVASAGILIGIAVWVVALGYAGMSAWVVVLFLGVYFLYAMATARIRAEIGPPAHDAEFMGPETILLNTLGPRAIGPQNIALFGRLFFMSRSYRSQPVGHQIEGFKLAQMIGGKSRHFLVAMIVASIVGTIAGFWALLHNMYIHGADNIYHNIGADGFSRLDPWLQNPQDQDYLMLRDVGIGIATTILLVILHQRFIWFPFHPVGFAVAAGWVMSGVWFSIAVAWAIKVMILRFGGIQLYRRMVPFFLGIIIGQHVVGGLWTIIGEVFRGEHLYQFFPYVTDWGR